MCGVLGDVTDCELISAAWIFGSSSVCEQDIKMVIFMQLGVLKVIFSFVLLLWYRCCVKENEEKKKKKKRRWRRGKREDLLICCYY